MSLRQKIVRGVGLAAKFGKHRRDIHVNVGVLIEKFSKSPKVVTVKGEMRGDEFRSRVHREKMIAFRHQRFKRRIFRRRPRALRKLFQLQPAFVVFVPGIEKRRRLGDVNQHRNAEVGAFFKHRRKGGIVHVDALAAFVMQLHAEVFENLQALRAVLDVLFKTLRDAFAEAGLVEVAVVHVRENNETIRIAAFHHFNGALQAIAGTAAQIHHHLEVDGVHAFDEFFDVAGRGIPVVAVNIDERKFRAIDFVFGNDERRFWIVFFDGERLLRAGSFLLREQGPMRREDH